VNLAGWAMLALVAVVAAARAASMPETRESAAAEARLDAVVSRCTEFSEFVSCAAALSMKPNEPRLLVAEGDALVQLRRPGEAIGVYRNAIRSGAPQDSVDPKIAVAQGLRRSLLHECETEAGAAAERACESAWLPGALDEVMVFKRRGLLLQNDNQPGASLDAYLAAARLAPRDREVARAVVALSGSTDLSDAATLTARGGALMTLGRPADAILSLREALRLAPDYAGAKVRLRIAEGAVAAQRRNSATVATLPATSRESLPAVSREAAAQDTGAFSNEAPVTRSN
jgi:tetratricopeptide (TPR) repeat protein